MEKRKFNVMDVLGEQLAGVAELNTSGPEQIEYIDIGLLDGDERNFYQLTDIDELADNIQMCGLQQPIRVRAGEGGRFTIVSGHRRRAALAQLVEKGLDQFRRVPCIRETDDASPALQELRLIFANSSTRKLTSAEIGEQAERVEALLYQLKEDGFEFPEGRMRDVVAAACNTHGSKLARIKVIREHLLSNLRPAWDGGKMPEQALPVGTVLTIAASGSEGSPDSIITNEKTLEKNGAEADCLRPCFSVLDPALTESLPAYQTACGITDIMAHTFERYFTNTPDVEVTDRMLEGVLLAMLHEGRRVMENPHNYEARANIMWAGMVCHNDIMGVGRQQDWNSHHLEHVLSAKYDCAHGAGLAVIMPAWMHYCAEHGGEKRLAQMAVRVFGCQMDFDDPKRTALEGIEAFRAFLRSIGMPLTFAEIGADPADIPELVEMNHIGDGKTGGYIGLDKQAHFDIYNLAAGSCIPKT